MKLAERIEVFSTLGEILRNSLEGRATKYNPELNLLIENQQFKNPWFTPENVRKAIKSVADELTSESLQKWTDAYPGLKSESEPIRVGVIMAGNIPLVGFHDLMSVLITGNSIIAKTSSKDKDLIEFICNILGEISSEFKSMITITDSTISGFDAVIATGSDNSARYFEYYFGKYPNLIRKNRSSVAIIDGSETEEELQDLGTDVFSYFGLGCRNVSKVYIPDGYDLTKLIRMWDSFSGIINHNKYANNYDYHKAIFLVNKEKFIDAGYLLLKENPQISSPVAVLYYESFKSTDEVRKRITDLKDKIQCIAGRGFIPFGKTQSPKLWDYADGVDTFEFLLKKNSAGIL